MASETPASDHPAPPSQEEVVKELQSDVKAKIESEAACPPGPAPAYSDPEMEAIPPASDQVKKIDEVEAALSSEDKPVVKCPAQKLVNKDNPVGSPEAGEKKAEVVCVSVEAAAEKPEDKQVEVPKDEVQQGIGVAPELLESPAEKVEECKIVHEPSLKKRIEDTPVEVEKKVEDAVIAKKVPAPGESTSSEPAEVEKKIESDSSILWEKSEPEPDEKEVKVSKPEAAGKEMVEESNVKPVVEVSPQKAGPEPAEKEVEELKFEPVGIESQERSGPESAEKEKMEELEVKPTKVVEPVEAAEDAAVSAAACKPEVAPVEQVEVPEAEDIKLLKEKETRATEISDQVKSEVTRTEVANNDNECYPTDKLIEKVTGEQGNLPSELAEGPIEVKGSLEDKDAEPKAEEKGVVGENLVPCEEKATEDVINFTPEKTSGHRKELRELAAETIEVRGSSDNKAVEPEKVEPKAEEKSVVAEELVPCAKRPAEAVINSAPPSQSEEKPTETIVTSRDIELEAENGKNREATAALVETEKDVETHEGKEDKEVIKEKTEAEDKAEEPVQPIEAKIEEEKQVDEPAKGDIQQSECNKDSEETKTTQEGGVNVKPQKQSIVKMVKQSLVKAKKAIIGKSHNSKTTASEPKDNANN